MVRIVQVDAFTDRPFGGNPAGVCLLDAPASSDWMQAVANEMNLSETAFLVRRDDDGLDLRWFTPACEVKLCGHATLASAHALWEAGHAPPDEPLQFHTLSGVLTCSRCADGWIEMDFPAHRVSQAPDVDESAGLAEALGGRPAFVGVTGGATGSTWFAVYPSAAEVTALRPNFGRLAEIGGGCAIVSAPGGSSFDFVSRFFAPGVGINEDPVTGSAHCSLGPYWSDRLGRNPVLGRQESSRGGTVRVEVRGQRVAIAGQAVTTLRGELTG